MKKLIIIALCMSIITGFVVYYYTATLETSLSVKTTPVVVAAVKIPKNTLIKPEMVLIKQLPEESVNELAAKNVDDVKGRIAKDDIQVDEQILSTRISDQSNNNDGLSYYIKEGYRALTVKTDEVTGISGRIKRGDYIDIMAILPNANATRGVVSQMVAENIEVLEVGIKPTNDKDKDVGQYTSITISVLAQDVLKINYALSEGKYNIALHSAVDKNSINPPPYSP